jgi:uncharacterized protein (TIGR02145 family)
VTYNGQVYNTLQIGSQCWLKENLNTGTMIPDNQDQSNNGMIEKYCFNNDPSNCDIYGGLYQWNEAMMYTVFETAQGICPPGWHIPSEAEYIELANYLGGNDVAGGKLKESCTTHWYYPNLAATNESGFTAMGAGARGYDGYFYFFWYSTSFWSSTQFDADLAGQRTLEYNNDNFTPSNVPKTVGYSIRCIKN